METIVKFAEHPYAQTYMVVNNQGTFLISYKTTVAGVDSNGWAWCNGLHSATTRKHIGWFAKKYNLAYQDFKKMFKGGYCMNVETGEIEFI